MMKRLAPRLPICCLAVVISFFSCRESSQQAVPSKQITLSAQVKDLINDTTSVSPFIDSLKQLFHSSSEETQLLLLGELAENWRAHTLTLASEELRQSALLNDDNGKGDAACKMGVYYCRKFDLDSAAYFFDKAEELARRKGLDDLLAQALSWQAETLRQAGENDKALALHEQALTIATKINDKKRIAFCNVSKGEIYKIKSEFEKAIDCYSKAVEYAKEVNDLNKVAIGYSGMGDAYRLQNNYPKALEYFNSALVIAKKNRNRNQVAFCLSCMGDIYSAQGETEKAIKLYEEAYTIAVKIGLKLQECNSLGSMGTAYFLLGRNDKALDCFEKALVLSEQIGNKDKMAFILCVTGEIHDAKKDYAKAQESFKRAIEISNETGNKNQLATVYHQVGESYFTERKYNDALNAAAKSLAFARETEALGNIKNAAKLLAKIYDEQKNYKGSSEMLQLFIQMKDSIGNEEQVKKFAAVEYKAKEDGLKAEQKAKEETFKAEQARKEEELKRQKTIRYAFTIGFALVLALALVVYRSLQQNKKQNRIISAQKKEMEHQKELVEEKNKEIIDSITYAKRLQDAILPPLKLVKQCFPESFVMYQPKDIIAGDFYWMHVSSELEVRNSEKVESIELSVESSKTKQENAERRTKDSQLIYIAAADSTGHGVPGAMVSVVCSNALNRAVKEFGITEPGKILDKVRELVVETFEKSENDVKDGMDISLLSVDQRSGEVLWSGANNPLWYVKNGELFEIKANKQPIGRTDDPKPFITHRIDHSPGTIYYLFTDGFADQFGGPKGKKYKYKQLEELLLANSYRSPEEQQSLLEGSFKTWKGHFDQVDDVTLIGVKL